MKQEWGLLRKRKRADYMPEAKARGKSGHSSEGGSKGKGNDPKGEMRKKKVGSSTNTVAK